VSGTVSGAVSGTEPKKINLLLLLCSGGYLMLPIAAMSLLVVTFGVERLLGLRRHKVLPPDLIGALGKLAAAPGGLDPRKAYKLCQQYPSTAANVIRAMLLKIGRPHSELEHAVTEADRREAGRLYANVRWLSLAAGVTPLLGLLGTVWGMIHAFFATANLPTGANKAEVLAEGIYMALVTTFAGLAVAIPAAVLAHMLEGRIQNLFRELDETLLGLMPQLERFEGRLRVNRDGRDQLVIESAAPGGSDGKSPSRPGKADKSTPRPDPTPT
jgi:biopolymer transport protein ExbB